MKKIKYYLSVGMYFIKTSIQSGLEYPLNLLGWCLATPIQFIIGFATIRFVVEQFSTLNGWGYEQLAFLYGLSVISYGLSVILFVQTWYMGNFIIYGEMDLFLLRPMNVLFQFLFMEFNLVGIADLIPGTLVFIYGCFKVNFSVSLDNIFLLVITIIGGTLIRGAVWLLCGSCSFWTKSSFDFIRFTQELFNRTTMYPLTIYPKSIQIIFTFILPLGWITFYPATTILAKSGGFVLPIGMPMMTLIIGIICFSLACAVFCRGMKLYESSGT
jgi:ABC-2 type transport system permease protein